LGAFLCSLTGHFLFDYIGRYWTFVLNTVFELCLIGLSMIKNLTLLYFIRIGFGYIFALFLFTVNIMIFEIMPP